MKKVDTPTATTSNNVYHIIFALVFALIGLGVCLFYGYLLLISLSTTTDSYVFGNSDPWYPAIAYAILPFTVVMSVMRALRGMLINSVLLLIFPPILCWIIGGQEPNEVTGYGLWPVLLTGTYILWSRPRKTLGSK